MASTTHQATSHDAIEMACKLHESALVRYAEGKSQQAESMFRRALRQIERVEGADAPDVAQVLNSLSAIYEDRWEYGAAERTSQRSVRIMEQVVDGGDIDLIELRIQSWQNLGRIHQAQGRYPEAERIFQQALAAAEQAYGRESAETADALHQLGMLYKYMGRFTEAGNLYQRALAIMKRIRRGDHPDLASLYRSLGGLEHAARNFARGEPYARRAVTIREKALGPDHPDVAADWAALAALLDGQKKYREAEALYRRALTVFERVYGEEHYEVAINLNNLAAVYQAQAKREQAERLYLRALAIKEKIFGPDHPDVAMTLNNLAVFYKANKQYDKAEPLYRRALGAFEKGFGPGHPNVPICLDNYAQLLRRMKRTEEARNLESRAKQIRSGLNLLTEDDVAMTGTINPQFTRFALVVNASGIHRQGVFAEERIPARRTVIEYTGERISRREAKRRSDSRAMVYLYRLDKYWALDGAVGGSGAEFFNHSCDPNLSTRIINGRIYYRSKRLIKPGEELTIDYSFSPDTKKTLCLCGSPKCRGTINRVKRSVIAATGIRSGNHNQTMARASETPLTKDLNDRLSSIMIQIEMASRPTEEFDPRSESPEGEIPGLGIKSDGHSGPAGPDGHLKRGNYFKPGDHFKPDTARLFQPPDNDLRNVLIILKRIAGDLLAGQDIRWEFTAPPDLDRINLTTEQCRHVYLIFREALRNIARHAGCSTVSLGVSIGSRWLEVKIHDNGCSLIGKLIGHSTIHRPGGGGLRNIQTRAAELGGSLEIASAFGWGTRLTLTLPLDE